MTADGTARTYEIDTDPERLDLLRVHHWLSTDTYWATGRPTETVVEAARNSVNFGAYDAEGAQVAYARVVTDHATFAWLCDVYVDRAHRGRGVGSLLTRAVVDGLRPLELKRVILSTLDAHEVYARVGFVPWPTPDRLMLLQP